MNRSQKVDATALGLAVDGISQLQLRENRGESTSARWEPATGRITDA